MDEEKAAAFRLEDVRDRLAGVSYVLYLMAGESTEQSPALRNLAREVDAIYTDMDEIKGGMTWSTSR